MGVISFPCQSDDALPVRRPAHGGEIEGLGGPYVRRQISRAAAVGVRHHQVSLIRARVENRPGHLLAIRRKCDSAVRVQQIARRASENRNLINLAPSTAP